MNDLPNYMQGMTDEDREFYDIGTKAMEIIKADLESGQSKVKTIVELSQQLYDARLNLLRIELEQEKTLVRFEAQQERVKVEIKNIVASDPEATNDYRRKAKEAELTYEMITQADWYRNAKAAIGDWHLSRERHACLIELIRNLIRAHNLDVQVYLTNRQVQEE